VLVYGARASRRDPASAAWTVPDHADLDALALQPLVPAPLPAAAATVLLFVTTTMRASTALAPLSYVNQTSWTPSETAPLLARPGSVPAAVLSGPQSFVVPAAGVVDLIVNNMEEGPHPLHLHGHSFWVLRSHRAKVGWGMYNWDKPLVLPVNASAPALWDTFVVPRRGHVVLRVRFDTPGVRGPPLYCQSCMRG
jgi:hypothetical protein